MCADENTPRRLGLLLTAVAELTLLASRKNAWIPPGPRAVMFRDYINQLGELLMEAGDAVSKEDLPTSVGTQARSAARSSDDLQQQHVRELGPSVYGARHDSVVAQSSGGFRQARNGRGSSGDSTRQYAKEGTPGLGAPLPLGTVSSVDSNDGHDVQRVGSPGDRKAGG